MSDKDAPWLGMLVLERGYATAIEVKYALWQHRANSGSKLGQILVDRHVITPEQLDDLLTTQRGWQHDSAEAQRFRANTPPLVYAEKPPDEPLP